MRLSATEQHAADAAGRVRDEHGYGIAPIASVIEFIEMVDPGALVAITQMPDGLDGMVLKDPVRGRVVVGISTTSVPERQRSSLAHELGHIVFDDYKAGTPSDCSARTPAEIRADHFARHLLAPLEGVRALLRESGVPGRDLLLADLADVVRHFGVSPVVARFQLERLGFLDPALSESWKHHTGEGLAAAFGHISEYRGNAARSAVPVPPTSLTERATRAYAENALGIGALARLMEMDAKVLKHALDDADITPRPIPSLALSEDDLLGL